MSSCIETLHLQLHHLSFTTKASWPMTRCLLRITGAGNDINLEIEESHLAPQTPHPTPTPQTPASSSSEPLGLGALQ